MACRPPWAAVRRRTARQTTPAVANIADLVLRGLCLLVHETFRHANTSEGGFLLGLAHMGQVVVTVVDVDACTLTAVSRFVQNLRYAQVPPHS